jgi:predicted ATPase
VGGSGKTRLAIEAARGAAEAFPDGICFAALAPLSDPAMVVPTIAGALDVKETGEEPLLRTVSGFLQGKRILLLLDNFEHVLGAAEAVAHLLAACPGVTILVTSRTPLHLTAEREYPVLPMPVPNPDHLPDPPVLGATDVIRLFVDRAQAVQPDFTLTERNAWPVAEICRRLDGLPLAVELAAARLKLFPPQTLVQRLDSRLTLLTGGARDRSSRQQTLRGAIDWSYSLLAPQEQVLFARLSIFAGGCSLEAAEAVCDPEGELEVLETIASLVDKSLVRQEGEEEPRFTMLETIREYAAERLDEEGQREIVARRHAAHFMALGEWFLPQLYNGHWQVLEQVEHDIDNVRAALTWSLAGGDQVMAAVIATKFMAYWEIRGLYSEGRDWIHRALEGAEGLPPRIRAHLLIAASEIESFLGDLVSGWLEEAIALFRADGDIEGLARALGSLSVRVMHDDPQQAIVLYEEGLQYFRQLNDPVGIAAGTLNLGCAMEERGDMARAEDLWKESLAAYRAIDHPGGAATALFNLARCELLRGAHGQARNLLIESLELGARMGFAARIYSALEYLVRVAAAEGHWYQAAVLCGMVDAYCDRTEVSVSAEWLSVRQERAGEARRHLGKAGFDGAYRTGHAMSTEDMVAFVSLQPRSVDSGYVETPL